MLDGAHYASAGMVSFARGLNDTPKIVALLLATDAVWVSSGQWGSGPVAAASQAPRGPNAAS